MISVILYTKKLIVKLFSMYAVFQNCQILSLEVLTQLYYLMHGNVVHLENQSSLIWMLTGTGNHERFIDITKIYEQDGELLTKSLIGFHAFTGCDFNPVFLTKGKKTLNLDEEKSWISKSF